MKRLFLASSGLSYIREFVKVDPSRLRMLFIPTAGNLDDNPWWIDKDRTVLKEMGFQVTEFDLEGATRQDMFRALDKTDIVYVAGGNTFYLLKQLRNLHLDEILIDYVNRGLVYAGASAGAIVAGKDIGPVGEFDEPEKVEGLETTAGLGLIGIVPIPHRDYGEQQSKIDAIREKYGNRFNIVALTDDEALAVENGEYKIVDSKRNESELQWLSKFS